VKEDPLRLDIVIPAHNEERRIERTLRSYRRVLDDPGVRFLVALDQCTDGTREIVQRHARRDGRVRLFTYPKLGKGGVIIETFDRSDAELVGFVDADCATPPRELQRLADVARRTGGAIATRRHAASVLPVRRPLRRRVASAGFSGGVRALMRLPYADTQCGAKVLRGDVARAALPQLTARGLLFDVDLLLAVRDLGVEVTEVPTVWVDRDGSRVDAVADSRRMGSALLALWMRRRRRGVVQHA
jgi:glycosyltransferase involved in cell wall biosynthesis